MGPARAPRADRTAASSSRWSPPSPPGSRPARPAGRPVTQPEERGGHRGGGADLLPPAAAELTGHPDAAHHRGLADIQRGDPLDDLLVVVCLLQHVRLLPSRTGPGGLAAGAAGREAKLVRVLEATVKGPRAQLPASD